MNHLVGWAFMVEKGAVHQAETEEFDDNSKAAFDNILASRYNNEYDKFFDKTKFKDFFKDSSKTTKKDKDKELEPTDNFKKLILGNYEDKNSKVKQTK